VWIFSSPKILPLSVLDYGSCFAYALPFHPLEIVTQNGMTALMPQSFGHSKRFSARFKKDFFAPQKKRLQSEA